MEVGVASGVSTVLLLQAIEALGLESRLYSFDIEDRYYADKSKPLGHFVTERFGNAPATLSMNPLVDTMRVTQRLQDLAAIPADFTFLDAEHSHPWPCLDLLALLDAMAPGSWGRAARHRTCRTWRPSFSVMARCTSSITGRASGACLRSPTSGPM